jgi:predicted nucleic acid-binding protein
MMYLDSCVIVKLLAPETDSELFQSRLDGEILSTSELAWTEVAAALCSKERAGALTPALRQEAWAEFVRRVEGGEIYLDSLDSVTVRKARQVLELCHPAVPLRTLDALHVAACDLSQDFPLCTTDPRMREAAKILGIPVFPEEAAV